MRRFEEAFPAGVLDIEGGGGADDDEEEDPCVVCLDPKVGQSCRRLNCGHSFHAQCIDTWWLKSGKNEYPCALCRQSQRAAFR
mmetsp:Transcript_35316/g.89794  ORF Transcript_35316/g.89794 Transcript_35316/m.89794 type:complete len:83 (+) Transcript_35316:450-698(+)